MTSPQPPPPVLVVGMHNSGTSILAEVLHRHGLFLGANVGHHENRFFSLHVDDEMIMGGGDRWARLPILTVDEVLAFRDEVGPYIHAHWLQDFKVWGYDGVSPWGFKDPRLCVLLPLYLELFPGARVLHIHREPDDVAASLARRPKKAVGVLEDPEHWKQLCLAYTERVRYCQEHYDNAYYEIQYEEFCTNPEPVTAGVFDFIGIPFHSDASQFVRERLDPSRPGSAGRGPIGWRLANLRSRLQRMRSGG